jgi:PAS domain S-box-containing protein
MTTHSSPDSKTSRSNGLPQASGERRLEDELKTRGDQQALLVEVSASLAGAADVEAALVKVLNRLRERVRLVHTTIYLLHSEEQVLHCVAESSASGVSANRTLALDAPGLVASAARAGHALYVADAAKESHGPDGVAMPGSQYAVPLLTGPSLRGVLYVESNRVDGIRVVTRKFLEQIAAQVALALERKALYKELKIFRERFGSIFEQNYFGVTLCDLEGHYSVVNRAFARLLGYEPDELRGRLYRDLIHPDDRQRSLECENSLYDGKGQVTVDWRYVRKSGEAVWSTTVISMIRDAAGHPAYLLAMVEDISARKKAEEERAQLQEQLVQSQKLEAIGTLAGGLAHDFNNFLGVILGFASLVRMRLAPEDPLQEPLQMIQQSAETATDLTRQLLGLARPEKPQRVPVNVEEVVKRVVKIVTQTFDRRIQVETRLAPELPWVEAETGGLEHAILNLCINARDAMPEGGRLTLETSVVTLGPEDSLRPAQCLPGDYVRIAIRDTGLGIEPGAMPHLFEPFFTTKERGRGSGLGLAMVHRIVRNQGGFVRVECEVKRGSQFSIFLPAVRRPPQLAAREEPAKVQYGSGTVLVVDDEPLILAFAERGLARLGYKVLTAEGGRRACEIYASQAQEIDCILLDVVMPEISGLETYQKLRQINPQARIILSSGYSLERVAREAREMGAADFIGKPYTLETLSRKLKTAHQA